MQQEVLKSKHQHPILLSEVEVGDLEEDVKMVEDLITIINPRKIKIMENFQVMVD